VGLVTDKNGCPVGVEIFRGNTSDQTTILEQAEKISEEYGVKDVIFSGDRGMLTPKRIAEVNELGYKTITALTHPQINKLLESKVIQLELFDDTNIEEIHDPDNPEIRYMLCRNPETARKETETRTRLVNKTSDELDHLKRSGKKRTSNELSSKVGRVMAKYQVEKYFDWEVKREKLDYSVDWKLVERDQAIDGGYIVRTDVDSEVYNQEETVKSYRDLARVEQAFRNLKTVLLEIRPIYHQLDERMTAQVFICMLAYYIQWHMMERLAPLFDQDGEGENRRWSVETVIARLKSIRIEKCILGKAKVAMVRNRPDDEQQMILELMGVKM
jgi:transposase